MHLDLALSWDSQIAAKSRSTINGLGIITQLCPYLEQGNLRMLVQTLLTSQVDRTNALYMGLPLRLTCRLQQVQNAADVL